MLLILLPRHLLYLAKRIWDALLLDDMKMAMMMDRYCYYLHSVLISFLNFPASSEIFFAYVKEKKQEFWIFNFKKNDRI